MKYIFPFLMMILVMSCDTDTKEELWSEQQKQEWVERCNQGFIDVPEGEKKAVANLCDCMLEEIMEDYSPEEAADLSQDQVRKVLLDCNYNW